MSERVFRFYPGRLWRNFVSLLPFAAFPVALHYMDKGDIALTIFFAILALAALLTVLVTAFRFRMVVDDSGLRCRGRFRTRSIPFENITSAYIRKGRDKASRFMGPPPFRELVLKTTERQFVISSLPLGPDAFDELLSILADKLPDEVFPEDMDA